MKRDLDESNERPTQSDSARGESLHRHAFSHAWRHPDQESPQEEARKLLSPKDNEEEVEARIRDFAQATGEKVDLARRRFLMATTGAAATLLALPKFSSLVTKAEAAVDVQSLANPSQTDLPGSVQAQARQFRVDIWRLQADYFGQTRSARPSLDRRRLRRR